MKRLKIALLLIFTISMQHVHAQAKTIVGKVTDAADGTPLIGVTIVVKGTITGTITDADGKYNLNVDKPGSVLIYSFMGMDSQEIAVGAQKVINVKLKASAIAMDEVVVTGMYKVDRRLFTGATDKISAKTAMLDGVADVSRMLEGRSAGVSVQNQSGTFGAAPKIRVRGATSIYGNQKPLWVVDGVVLEDIVDVGADDLSSGDAVTLISSAIAGLNADDIESFQILKDGSATSIYGARAMSGVIIVTTKRGHVGVTSLNYTLETTFRAVPRYSQFNIMNSQDQMGVYREMEEKGWLNHSYASRTANGGVYNKMYNEINSYDVSSGKFGLANTPEARANYLQRYEMANTDWFDELFTMTPTQNHSMSISSGSEKARFYASLSYFGDPGWTLASQVDRYTTNMNVSLDINKKLTLTLLTSGSMREQTAPGTLDQKVNIVEGEVSRDFDINPYSYALNTSRTLTLYDEHGDLEYFRRNYAPFNIKHELENNFIEYRVADLKFQGEIDYKLNSKISFKALTSMRYSATTQENHVKENSNQAQAYRAADDSYVRDNNKYLYKDPAFPNALPEVVLPKGGVFDQRDFGLKAFDFRASGTYNNTFGAHIVNLFGGLEARSTSRKQSWFRGWGYQYERGGVPFTDPNIIKQMLEGNNDYYSRSTSEDRSAAFFGTGTYSYKGKYTLNLTGRYEGSNQLGKSRAARWLPTWNVAGAWNVHEESFFKSLTPTLSHLTLRGSYSLTAVRGPASNSLPIFRNGSIFRPYVYEKESQIYIESLQNNQLTWEKKHELNLGVDIGFLKNRINFLADYYVRNNYDLIGRVETSGVGGEYYKLANYANLNSSGVEMTLSTKNIEKKDFSWRTDFTLSKTKNTITNLNATPRMIDLISGTGTALQGYPVRALFSIPFAGLNDEGLPTYYQSDGSKTITDINFQERSDLSHLIYEGPTDPTLTGGFGNVFTYKGFKLNVFVTYSFGNVIRLNPTFSSHYSDLTASPKEMNNRWMIPGDEMRTSIPVLASYRQNTTINNLGYAYNAYNYSSERIADGGFIRMKEISLSYDIKKTWREKMKLKSCQLKLQMTNPFLIYADSKLNGQDPEFFQSGGVALPVPQQYTITVRIGI